MVGRIIFQIKNIHHFAIYFHFHQAWIFIAVCHGIGIGIPAWIESAPSTHVISAQVTFILPVLAM